MIIEVRPCKKFKGAWAAFEAPGVEPAFAEPDGRDSRSYLARLAELEAQAKAARRGAWH